MREFIQVGSKGRCGERQDSRSEMSALGPQSLAFFCFGSELPALAGDSVYSLPLSRVLALTRQTITGWKCVFDF